MKTEIVKKHTNYLFRDFSGEIFFLQNALLLLTRKCFWTAFNKFKAILFNIKIKSSTNFIGNTIFHRFQFSSISIGERCLFNSSSHFNLIGVNHPCIISTHSEKATIKIGNNCGFSGTVIGACESINIGDNVRCGANTTITDFDWHTDDSRTGAPKKVEIGDNVWLGLNSIVLKGVSIGANSLIGANSVVTKNIPANVIAAGNPCTVIRKL